MTWANIPLRCDAHTCGNYPGFFFNIQFDSILNIYKLLSIITEIRIFIGWLVSNTPGELFNYISVLNLVKISPIVSDVERDRDTNNN